MCLPFVGCSFRCRPAAPLFACASSLLKLLLSQRSVCQGKETNLGSTRQQGSRTVAGGRSDNLGGRLTSHAAGSVV